MSIQTAPASGAYEMTLFDGRLVVFDGHGWYVEAGDEFMPVAPESDEDLAIRAGWVAQAGGGA